MTIASTCLLGDGEIAEGSVWEAAALATHYRLDNLVGIIDVNGLGQSQRTMYDHDTTVYHNRFAAFGWHTVTVDGHDMPAIVAALDQAQRCERSPDHDCGPNLERERRLLS